MIQNKVLKFSYKISNQIRTDIIKTLTDTLNILEYNKPKPRTMIVPGDPNLLPNTLDGGFVKSHTSHAGTVFVTPDSHPGYQIEADTFQSKPINEFFDGIVRFILDSHSKLEDTQRSFSYKHNWFYISPPSNTVAEFHDHLRLNNTFPFNTPHYTWTYYIQLPDNCKRDEGMLVFKEKDSTNEYKLKVEYDTLYLFPSSLLHKPNIAPNSTLDRITAAGNILIPNTKKSLFTEI